jgi:dihydropteroate synthase
MSDIFDLHQWLDDPQREPIVMGVLNVTPDSFSDGGRWIDPGAAAEQAERMLAEKAAIIDVGGESTRPGSTPVDEPEQIRRVAPVIERIARLRGAVVSIDTTRAAVARAALDAGASLVNDVSAGRDDPAMLPLVAERRVAVALMHMQGTPATMQRNPTYSDVTAEVRQFLAARLAAAVAAGVDAARVILDPGIGFGKTDAHNLQLLRDLPALAEIGRPLLVGSSRKAFIGRITGEADASDRLAGTTATVVWSVVHGASILRVHDVEPMVRAIRMIRAIQNIKPH